ncbi:NAD dependent epimerase/dehydratase family protein-like protein [Lentithecium fluviatile CBS 122367]|uniref:NAD dependent epimerase/dehydratase family protein-like protein n=1 Tax=Lentithecium fluviatile CBS 122367 TaxID=1168545 RepID=A0A6G1JHQ3_9PLEO|nr:NAD dependent epimerase/dehydratase family protein-like protein [Lentithecium fluviatile CBS 122367]
MSTPTQQTVQSCGIYHGLPVYPASLKNLTAIITGANGISGNYMLRVLSQSPERWSKIYCLSRRPPMIPEGLPANAEHVECDFLKGSGEIARCLQERGVRADYVFFYSYVQVKPKKGGGLWSDAEEMCKVNLALLQNFCEALPLAGIKPKRIMLQTGAKNYGLHLGPVATPSEEHHPRITLEPNFYYLQEDFLWSFCRQHSISWNVVMPSYILGAVPDAAMNLVYPLGIYAAVTKFLKGKLEFPADLKAWEATCVGSSARLNGYLEEWVIRYPVFLSVSRFSSSSKWRLVLFWLDNFGTSTMSTADFGRAVLNDDAKDQKFNAADGGPFTWGGFWPKFASWHGIEAGTPSMDDAAYTKVTTPYEPPPRGFGPPATYRIRFTLVDWAKRPEVQKAWEEIMAKNIHKGTTKLQDMDIDRIFAFADGSLAGGTLDLSMNKARKMGWHGLVDTSECFREVLGEFVGLGMLPPVGSE